MLSWIYRLEETVLASLLKKVLLDTLESEQWEVVVALLVSSTPAVRKSFLLLTPPFLGAPAFLPCSDSTLLPPTPIPGDRSRSFQAVCGSGSLQTTDQADQVITG